MQRLLTVFLVLAAMATVASGPALADNQEVADQIAKALRGSGQLSNYKIEVKYQNGTTRLKGHVQNQTQMNTALRLALQTPEVTRVINDLTPGPPAAAGPRLASWPPAGPRPPAGAIAAAPRQIRSRRSSAAEWLKNVVSGGNRQQRPRSRSQPANGQGAGRAQRVPSSFSPAPARQIAMTQPVAVPQPVTQTQTVPRTMIRRPAGRPIPIAYTQGAGGMANSQMPRGQVPGGPMPAYVPGTGGGVAPARYDQPRMPNYSWPSYAAYPNYAGLTYPRQYSPTAWPYIGPFYPYPQVPLGWRKVTLEWDDGWWMLDFRDAPSCCR